MALTFDQYVSSLAPVRAAPSLAAAPEHVEIRAAVDAIEKLGAVDQAALAQLFHDSPAALGTFALAVGLSKERLGNWLRHQFGTSGYTKLSDPTTAFGVIVAMDTEFQLVDVLAAERGKTFNYADVLVARAGTRQRAGEAQAGGRGIEDAVEALAVGLKLPYELRTRFTGRGDRDAPCDLAIPGGGTNAQIVCAAKGFDSTGSKLGDAVREIEEMAEVRLPRQFVYAVVDGIGWHRRRADLQRIFGLFESNRIDGLYTVAMLPTFQDDLEAAAKRLGLI
jgi:hypothetical protein